MDGEKFVERINALLKLKGKSKLEFYSDLELSNNSITAWGKKNQVPSAEVALKIATYLNTSVEYLITGTEADGFKEKYDNLKSEMEKVIKSN